VISHIQQEKNIDSTVGFFFFDYRDPGKQTTKKAFETILAQMARQDSAVLSYLEKKTQVYRDTKSTCNLRSLYGMFLECLSVSNRKVTVLIDALDECRERPVLLQALEEILTKRAKARVFLTSRKEFDIEKALSSLPQIHLDGNNMAADIKSFVESQVSSLIRDRKIRIRDPVLGREIQEALCAKADGM
jgi:hypothetical protein